MSESWLEKSAQLSRALASAGPEGGKLLKIERIARERQLSAQTVHHLLRAHDFVERLRAEDEELLSLIAALPYQGVIAAERWYARDRAQLVAYLTANGKPSVRQFAAAEKQSRGLPTVKGEPANHAIDVLQSVGSAEGGAGPDLRKLFNWAGIKGFDLTSVAWERERGDYERAHGIEFHGVTPSQDRVALLVGPNSEATGHYVRSAKMMWFNAVSAASLFPVVIMLLPTRAAQAACLNSMPLPPNGERGWPKWNSPGLVRGQPCSGPARPATPTTGIILFTTPETLLSDWQR